MNIDVILSWPRNTDFPLWRQWLRDNRSLFQKVIIVFTETNQGADYQAFLRSAMAQDDVTFVDIQPTPVGRDWRDVAVNKGLEYSDAEWVWFTEQDFLMPDPEEFIWTLEHDDIDIIGFEDGGRRYHPASIAVLRSKVDKTSKNFGIDPGRLDHFGIFLEEILKKIKKENLCDAIHWGDYHMNGLTHNMNLVYNGGEPNYKPEEFKKYLEDCLKVTVPQDERFLKLCTKYLRTSTMQAS